MAAGDLGEKLDCRSSDENGQMAASYEQVRDNLKVLISDTEALVEASLEGRLSTRADASKHQGDFRKIVQGINGTLDAVTKPVTEAAGVLDTLALNDLSVKVVGDYKGDHAKIKESLNKAIEKSFQPWSVP
jgi:methyl-accepting chemotaxis protein